MSDEVKQYYVNHMASEILVVTAVDHVAAMAKKDVELATAKRVIEKLRNFATHGHQCYWAEGLDKMVCKCGLENALAAIEKASETNE